jgi:UDP-N-acetylglucosamine 3-dehydrogenase
MNGPVNMREVSVAIIGAGFWGKNHARVLKEIPGVRLTHVCDIEIDRAKELALRYGIPKYMRDYREVLSDDVDAVILCTPSTTHAEIALAVIREEKHVLIEKPMATTIKQAEDIVAEARRNKSMVMVGFIERFNPAVELGKELIEKGEIGRIILSYSKRIGSWPERIGDIGVVKDTAIHDIDLAMYIFNVEPISVYAKGGSIKHKLEDHVQAVLSFEGDKSALIEANWLTPRKKREMHITGEEGVISIQFISREIVVEKAEGSRSPMVKQVEPLMAEVQHFINCIRNYEKPLVSEVEGLKATLIAEAILESMKTGAVVNLEEFKDRELTITI